VLTENIGLAILMPSAVGHTLVGMGADIFIWFDYIDCSERVLQHLVNVYCKPYLLYGADVINWNNSDLSSITHAFNSALCKVYKVKFQLLDSQRDIVQDIALRCGRYEHKLLSSKLSH